MEHQVTIPSDGLKLSGVLQVPDQRAANERRPAIIVLHGFGSNEQDLFAFLYILLKNVQIYRLIMPKK